jgi:hypothetical protein
MVSAVRGEGGWKSRMEKEREYPNMRVCRLKIA